ncbi:MAG: hypothetical protein J0H60_22625 [Rhizobiales bacterium]|nr:hypothetical protein [Hyphomicrobiales bacterium]
MARLLDWPRGLGVSDFQWLSGPRAINATTTETVQGVTQTVASPFGAWSFQVTFPPLWGARSRRHRGWIGALQGGANATRFPFIDGDRMLPAEAGVNIPRNDQESLASWENGRRWSNGRLWKGQYPLVPVTAAADLGGSQISLADAFWGRRLDIGDFVGFLPFHFGLYQITEVIVPGTYRIWPTLRAALTTDSFATLKPVMAVRLMGEGAAQVQRDVQAAQNMTASFIEIMDYDVRDYFAE